ncbi:MAG: glutamate 5-kinase [Thaumarchaeota archaeon]|nr:glutamate 5-kinase [Nitrososphaerota archaeon]
MTSGLAVVKVGTSSLSTKEGKLDEEEMRRLADQIAGALKRSYKVVLVTSGAVAAGIAELGLARKPNHDIVFRQVSAATGQSVLMAKYRELFKPHGVKVAQILLTAEDLSNRGSYLHTCNVLKMLLKMGLVPVVNENDVTSVDELKSVSEGFKVNFSDNDILSALVANAIRADILIILSDVDGLYTMNPRNPEAVMIKNVDDITSGLKNASIDGKSSVGKGGMQSKIKAAEIATKGGIPVVIANSRRENVILDILAGKEGVGTYFRARGRMPAVKTWLAFGASVKGQIWVNEGAKRAILEGSSLLAVGITKVEGHFRVGDVVSIMGPDNSEFAKGNPNYNSDEINTLKGLQVSEIRKRLGNARSKEIVLRKKILLTVKGREAEELC